MESSKCRQRQIIGYWVSEKKIKKPNWCDFFKVSRSHGFDVKEINLNRPLEEQGPFHVIFHELTEIISVSLKNDQKAKAMVKLVEDYIKYHPETVIIDPIENVKKLLDRYTMYKVIHESTLHNIDVFTPSFVELTSKDASINLQVLKKAGVNFPFVCKPAAASGTNCHEMSIVFNEPGLKECRPPCVAHSFVNHNAILYKIFVVGEEYHILERPSLKNFYPDPDKKTIHFNSHDVSKPHSKSLLSILDESESHLEPARADPQTIAQIVDTMRDALGISLFGIDVVVENKSGRHAIIDINEYPGYDGYPNLYESVLRLIKTKMAFQSSMLNIYQPEDDSGFETGDSSDEKKKIK